MQLKLSKKYQVIIPKDARKKLHLGSGLNYMTVKRVTGNEITFVKSALAGNKVEKYAGILKSADNPKPVANLRKMRDEDWN